MPRRARRRVVALALGLMLLAGTGAGAATVSRPPARMLVYAQEWSLWSSRPSLPHGTVLVELWNRGQDAHDLRVRHVDRHGHMFGHPQDVSVTVSGALGRARWHLRSGRYELYCSMPGHLAHGMHALLTVR